MCPESEDSTLKSQTLPQNLLDVPLTQFNHITVDIKLPPNPALHLEESILKQCHLLWSRFILYTEIKI